MVEWLAHGLRLRGPAHIESAAARIAKDYRKRHAITFEAWVRPEAPAAKEPAPILQLTGCSLHQLVLIGHGVLDGSRTAYRGFLMPPDPGDMKSGWIAAPEPPVGPRLTHVVLTRERGGTRLYIDGVERAAGRIPAEVPHCQYPLRLVLGAASGDANAWCGEIHLAAVYARALAPDEVKRNKLAGCGGAACGMKP
jgi:hypothetical protein